MLTIYTKPGCHPCRLTIKTANKLGLNYQEKPAKEHTGYLATLGHASAPVIVDEAGNSFSGFRPERVSVCLCAGFGLQVIRESIRVSHS